jgi:hypothetical protein
MGKTSKTFAIFLALIMAVSCLTLFAVKPADAQLPSIPDTIEEPKITIVSPSGKQVERNTTVELYIYVLFFMNDRVRAPPEGVQISYKLDNSSITALNGLEMFQWSNGWWEVWGKTLLVDLAEGGHKLTAYSTSSAGLKVNTTTTFTVDTNYEYPKMSVLSPQNKTYTTSDIPVIFYVNGNISEGYGHLEAYPYSAKTIQYLSVGNMTLSGLKDGIYRLTFSAITERGKTTETIAFSVNTDFFYRNQPIIITIGIIAILLTVLALLRYKTVKRGKRQSFCNQLSKDPFQDGEQ